MEIDNWKRKLSLDSQEDDDEFGQRGRVNISIFNL